MASHIVADGQHQPAREDGSGTAAQSQVEMLHDLLQPPGAPRSGCKHIGGERFGKHLLTAKPASHRKRRTVT